MFPSSGNPLCTVLERSAADRAGIRAAHLNVLRSHWLKTTCVIEINSLSAFILKALEQRRGDTHFLFYVFCELINNLRPPGACILWRDFS